MSNIRAAGHGKDSIGEISRLLPQIYKKYRAPFARRIAGSDLTVRGALLLRAVDVLPDATVGDVAREMAVTASTASIVLSGLERKGLLRRRYRVLGRSRTALELTAAGRRALASLRPSLNPSLLSAALRRLRPSDRDMLLEGLRRLDSVEIPQERRIS
ncbi:MAG TPA: MarR family winged helix-turn-helix transcriptional regulator [Candidatus Eremiobacteraceae bacterium]|nr:MarR family winged helix-turn-helix transcriptional regulator [Candidatus Eremiobacteraceae bacterium]